jgi:hypothetical protein
MQAFIPDEIENGQLLLFQLFPVLKRTSFLLSHFSELKKISFFLSNFVLCSELKRPAFTFLFPKMQHSLGNRGSHPAVSISTAKQAQQISVIHLRFPYSHCWFAQLNTTINKLVH